MSRIRRPSRRRTLNDKLTLILPDAHFPDADPRAIEAVEKVCEALRPWRVVHLGDLLDCLPFTRHPLHKLKQAQDYDWEGMEIAPARRFIERLKKNCGYYHQLWGNHEERAERWCVGAGNTGEAIWSMINPKVRLLGGFSKDEVGFTPYVSKGDISCHYKIAKDLLAVHGWSFARHASAVHLGKSAMAGCSVVHGHTHRIQVDSARNPLTGRVLKAWSPGCLANLAPEYTQVNGPTSWAHGFSLVYVGKHSWTDYTIVIDRGYCVLPDGSEVKV